MARERVRVVLVCEDTVQRDFFSRLLERIGKFPLHVFVAPPGGGSAEQWVRETTNKWVRIHRSKAHHQPKLALLIVTDGDRFGVRERKRMFDDVLVASAQLARTEDERIALCIPTWSIETWLGWLCDCASLRPVDENTRYKMSSAFNACEERGEISSRLAVEAWVLGARDGEEIAVPSLSDTRLELQRIP